MTAPSPGGAQRWAITHTVCEQRIRTAPFEADDGDWVRYGDIAGMVGENERLAAEVAALTKRLSNHPDEFDSLEAFIGSMQDDSLEVYAALEKKMAEVARLRKALEKATPILLLVAGPHDRNSVIGIAALECTEALRGAAGEVRQ